MFPLAAALRFCLASLTRLQLQQMQMIVKTYVMSALRVPSGMECVLWSSRSNGGGGNNALQRLVGTCGTRGTVPAVTSRTCFELRTLA